MSDINKTPTEIRRSNITKEQLVSAEDFLTAMGWKEAEPTRQVTRADIAFLIAWYGALRYQAGSNHIGSLEKPTRLIETTPKPSANRDQVEFEIIELTDLVLRPLVSDVS